jgi:leucyl-tRNA synthetase
MPMFPYPSGDSMHVGHASNYIINDFVARYKKMQGYDVIHPMGFDSFGLPTENYAIKTGKSARQATKDNIVNFKEQIKAINLQFDPEREFATSDPEYYKRTQWIFARLFEHGLAYKKDGLVNRCNGCQTVLANDQVVDGKCERCETVIIQKKHPQRYIKTTALADELIDDLDDIDRPEETKTIQKNWIGRSFGAEIDFGVVQKVQNIQVVQNIQKVQSFSEKNNGEEYDEKTKIII